MNDSVPRQQDVGSGQLPGPATLPGSGELRDRLREMARIAWDTMMNADGTRDGEVSAILDALICAHSFGMQQAPRQWQPIETAPRDGTTVLLYRPLAGKTHDPVVIIGRSVPYNGHSWPATIPEGVSADGPGNYTDRVCYATHWQPLPEPPK